MPLAKKPSAEATYERRVDVFRMKMRGLNHSVIARELGVNRNTIIRDSEWIKENLRELAASTDKFSEMGTAMAKLDEIEKEAMFHFNETENPHAKNNFLLTAITACEKRIRLAMDAGLIEKAPVHINMSVEEIKKMTTQELLNKRTEILSRLQQSGVPSARN
jgi:transcriptional regulator